MGDTGSFSILVSDFESALFVFLIAVSLSLLLVLSIVVLFCLSTQIGLHCILPLHCNLHWIGTKFWKSYYIIYLSGERSYKALNSSVPSGLESGSFVVHAAIVIVVVVAIAVVAVLVASVILLVIPLYFRINVLKPSGERL